MRRWHANAKRRKQKALTRRAFEREAGRARRERLDQRLRPVYRGTDGYLATWG